MEIPRSGGTQVKDSESHSIHSAEGNQPALSKAWASAD